MTEQDKQALIKHFCERDCGEAAKNCTIMPCHEIELIQEFQTTEPDPDTISRQAALDIFDDYNVAVENGQIEAYSRDRKRLCDLPPAQLVPDNNGDLWITVQDIDEVTCIYVQESKSKFCRIFYEEKEQPEIIRCKDCKHRDPEDKKCDCGHDIEWQLPRQDDWYCADGER